MKSDFNSIFPEDFTSPETQFRFVLDSLAEAFFIVSPVKNNEGKIIDFVYVYVNDALARMSHLKKEDMTGRRVSEIIIDFTQSPLFPLYCEAAESDEPITLKSAYFKETVVDKSLGGYYDMVLSAYKGGVVIILHDVTEAKNKELKLEENADALESQRNSLLKLLSEYNDAETALEKSEEVFRRLFENSFDAILLTEPGGKINRCNPAAEILFGYKEEELKGIGRDGVADLSDPNWERSLKERKETGKYIGQLRYKKKDGSSFTGEVSSIMFRLKDNSVRTCTIIRDITDRMAYEKQIQKVSRQLSDIIEGTPSLVFVKDLDGHFILANRRLEAAIGMSSEEILGKTDYDFFSKETADTFRANDNMAIQSGKVQTIMEEVALKDGVHHYFLSNKFPLCDEFSKPYAVCGILTDITNMKVMELTLLESQAKLLNVQKLTHVGSATHDILTDKVEWSDEAFNIMGRDKSKGLPSLSEALNLIHPEDRDAAESIITHAIETQSDYETEFRIISEDGKLKYIHIKGSAIFDENGRLVSRIAGIMDITERKLQELEIKHTLEELKRSNEDLEQFAYIASHDLQEPLRMVSSFARLLSKQYAGKLDEKADAHIDYIVDGTKRMHSLINDLLQYARVTTQAQPFVTVDLNQVLDNVLFDLRMAIDEKGAYISYSRLPSISADPVQIRQLLQNLISNAIKFKGENAPEIYISAERKRDEWFFSVKDNGIGIAPEYQERIFVIFQRLHERDKYSGTGIGLAICKKIVERHGGRIWVESEEGHGSTFHFTIKI